ncbi:hypothetical protein [Arthrobacter oryzae]|uniref:hypothetical protein n=1 Tax=Arthrobacter oryzae TaxID=409290 RepID=UPI00286512BE|nr:hypothetical protein [Arthrobacter oryzae]MDR6508629.1 hypothetical protein [Arthrobacter oryzae]
MSEVGLEPGSGPCNNGNPKKRAFTGLAEAAHQTGIRRFVPTSILTSELVKANHH